MLDYAREQVRSDSRTAQRPPAGALVVSPRPAARAGVIAAAAAATLRTRAAAAEADDVEEADALGRARVLDTADDEALEAADVDAGADDRAEDGPRLEATDAGCSTLARAGRRRSRGRRTTASWRCSPARSRRSSPTATTRSCSAASSTPPTTSPNTSPRRSARPSTSSSSPAPCPRASARSASPSSPTQRRPHVLVATDCLSEGVNLQDHFQAVVHYDLAWNPTRHEQREGRVDRFGQRATSCGPSPIYGSDNRIDGIVLDVLLRKHEAIRKATGVSVPVPDDSDSVVEALLEGLMLRGA